MAHSATCAIQYDWPCNCGEDDKEAKLAELTSRLSAAEKERDEAYRLAEKCNLECDEYKVDNERLAKERDEALAWGEKLKEYIRQRGWEFENIEAPAALSHLRQEIIERCAAECWPNGKVWSEAERDAMAEAFKRAEQRGRGFYETLFAVGATVAKANAASIRRLITQGDQHD